jgi:ferredoxin
VPIVYVEADGTEKRVDAEVGMNLMEVAHANNVELEGELGGRSCFGAVLVRDGGRLPSAGRAG